MVSLINPGMTLAQHKQAEPSESDTTVEINQIDELSQDDELPETKNKNSVLSKVVIAVGALAALAVAGYCYSGSNISDSEGTPGYIVDNKFSVDATI